MTATLRRSLSQAHRGGTPPYHVQQWDDSYAFSKTSRRNYLRSVKRCLTWATRQGYIDHNPVQHLEVPAGEHREVVISEEEYRQLLEYAGHDVLRDLLVITWESGCRPQESLRVEARHVDVANRRWVLPVSESKGKRISRIVYLTDEAWRITERLMVQHPTGKLFRNSRGQAWTSEAVNCGFDRIQARMGKAIMDREAIAVTNDEIAEFITTLKTTRIKAGHEIPKTAAELRHEAKSKLIKRKAMSLVPHLSLYALRHSWATHALERGLDSITVAVLMGHSDASTLARVYQHLGQNPKYLSEQAKKATA